MRKQLITIRRYVNEIESTNAVRQNVLADCICYSLAVISLLDQIRSCLKHAVQFVRPE